MAETKDGRRRHRKPHAIFIPYPLQGHVIPSVHLAVKLASHGFTVTFVNTHYIHHKISTATGSGDVFSKLRESSPGGESLDIRYATVSDGLPLGFDRSLNHDQFMASLLHVFSAHVEELVAGIVASGEEVSCLITDTFFVWPAKVAKKFGLVCVSFWTEPALVYTLYHHVHLLRQNGHFGCQDRREDAIEYIPGVASIEPKDTTSYLQEAGETSVCHQIIFRAFQDARGADFVVANTVQELEAETISALQAQMSYYAIGPIFPPGFVRSAVGTSLWSESDCSHWLDARKPGSVLYVSFGSYAHVEKTDLVEIARGLALSGVSFVWVLRDDIVSSDDPNPLPVGFREEVSDRSMIVGWCSQKEVLAHPAIGGLLTHCGWNSILEAAWCGVPLLCFPLYTDQFTNRKLVVDDWKVGINLVDCKAVRKEDVAKNIGRLMGGELGDDPRKRAKEVKKILASALGNNGSSSRNFGQFVEELKNRIQTIGERRS
ncbi:unnamed protein product [Linum trigynum]|uniref:Glycosyltransferase n=1 Tax=Linum trigynum TaxID=586398 RepID=A0AAV2G0Q0_9ROSI